MAEITIAGIKRAGTYSPNHIGNDTAIFNAVAEHLRKRGCIVNIYSEDQFIKQGAKEPVIINMCRDRESVKRLQALEEDGRVVINSGYGIENCARERMARILMGSGVNYPESIIVNTDEEVKSRLGKLGIDHCWIKRGDFQTIHKEDVSFARHSDEAQDVLHEYFYRGIKRAVISKHIAGDMLKFYGVKGQPFFHWFYPLASTKPADHQVPAINEQELREKCEHIASELGIDIYGGDCIVSADGTVWFIDFNDWPSFAPCRDKAAPYIAKCIIAKAKETIKK